MSVSLVKTKLRLLVNDAAPYRLLGNIYYLSLITYKWGQNNVHFIKYLQVTMFQAMPAPKASARNALFEWMQREKPQRKWKAVQLLPCSLDLQQSVIAQSKMRTGNCWFQHQCAERALISAGSTRAPTYIDIFAILLHLPIQEIDNVGFNSTAHLRFFLLS